MNPSEKLPFFSNPDEEKRIEKIQNKPKKRKTRPQIAKEKKEGKEKKEKKLFFTYITEGCQYGDRPVPVCTMASTPEKAQHNIKTRYNIKRGNKLEIFVKMKPIKLYSEMTAKEKEDARRNKSFNDIHSLGQFTKNRELFVNSGKRKKYYVLDTEENTIYPVSQKKGEAILSRLQEKAGE